MGFFIKYRLTNSTLSKENAPFSNRKSGAIFNWIIVFLPTPKRPSLAL